jgi:hypothetical protein
MLDSCFCRPIITRRLRASVWWEAGLALVEVSVVEQRASPYAEFDLRGLHAIGDG